MLETDRKNLCSVLPVLAALFLCSFLDRTNVGNAKILGLADDIHLKSDMDYTQGLAVFYATYILRYELTWLFRGDGAAIG